MEILKQMEAEGMVSTRGLRKDATLFNEIIIDVNTMYFERMGGYEYIKEFYAEAYRLIEKKFGAENVISAVMHADELNEAATDELGKDVYHYHLHAIVLPVVEKEILWSKRCKDPQLRGTVKEVIKQISHSKKCASNIPIYDEKGNPILRRNGKQKYRKSYSILHDELFQHMTEHGFKGFQRGEMGSTTENLTALQYKIKQDKERLNNIQEQIQKEQITYESSHKIYKTFSEIDDIGQKNLMGKVAMTKDDYSQLTTLAKEGITSREKIYRLQKDVTHYQDRYYENKYSLDTLREKYNELVEICKPFLVAMEHFPALVKSFVNRFKELFRAKEEQERRIKEEKELERKLKRKQNKNKRGWER